MTNSFPWTPQHGQPADADGFIDEAEAKEVVVDKPTTEKAASRTRVPKAKSKKATN